MTQVPPAAPALRFRKKHKLEEAAVRIRDKTVEPVFGWPMRLLYLLPLAAIHSIAASAPPQQPTHLCAAPHQKFSSRGHLAKPLGWKLP